MADLPDIGSAEWAGDALRRDVFQLIAWGHAAMTDQIRQCRLEEEITGLIRLGIRKTFDEELPPRYSNYFAANEDPVDHGPYFAVRNI